MKKTKKTKNSAKDKKNKKSILKVLYENKGKIYSRTIEILAIILTVYSIFIALLVRQDTAELTKLSEKPIYYKIKIYPTEPINAYESDKYVRLNLNLIVDDFEIYKEKFMKVNYNSVFTHINYYMVYDYDLNDKPVYYYKLDNINDDRIEAQMRLEDKYHIEISESNYSLTPNKKYCYILIHTQTLSENNLDLVFFKYNIEESNNLEFIEVDNRVYIDITDIRDEQVISREYYTSSWAENEEEREDISFMFDVYEDLRSKIKEQL